MTSSMSQLIFSGSMLLLVLSLSGNLIRFEGILCKSIDIQRRSAPTKHEPSSGYDSELDEDSSVSAVIPSPNERFDDKLGLSSEGNTQIDDIIRKLAPSHSHETHTQQQVRPASASSAGLGPANSAPVPAISLTSDSKAVPVYVSPFVRANSHPSIHVSSLDDEESSSPVSESKRTNYASPSSADLKTSASYGSHHGYDHGHKGWLDMGAWTGGKGSFGWYADYPVGSHKHHHY